MSNSQPTIYGSFESVHLPEFSSKAYIAKVDTGAYSGAIHCAFLRERTRNGTKVLHFRPLGLGQNYATQKYTKKYVRSSNGHRVKRYVIKTTMEIRGESYEVSIGLSDRQDMQYEILIGRKFLREHGILVDVRENSDLDKDLDKTLNLDSDNG